MADTAVMAVTDHTAAEVKAIKDFKQAVCFQGGIQSVFV